MQLLSLMFEPGRFQPFTLKVLRLTRLAPPHELAPIGWSALWLSQSAAPQKRAGLEGDEREVKTDLCRGRPSPPS
jgi:hypothetical protein